MKVFAFFSLFLVDVPGELHHSTFAFQLAQPHFYLLVLEPNRPFCTLWQYKYCWSLYVTQNSDVMSIRSLYGAVIAIVSFITGAVIAIFFLGS